MALLRVAEIARPEAIRRVETGEAAGVNAFVNTYYHVSAKAARGKSAHAVWEAGGGEPFGGRLPRPDCQNRGGVILPGRHGQQIEVDPEASALSYSGRHRPILGQWIFCTVWQHLWPHAPVYWGVVRRTPS